MNFLFISVLKGSNFVDYLAYKIYIGGNVPAGPKRFVVKCFRQKFKVNLIKGNLPLVVVLLDSYEI